MDIWAKEIKEKGRKSTRARKKRPAILSLGQRNRRK